MRSRSRLAMLVSTAAVAIAAPVANAHAALPVPYGSAAVAQGELGELNTPNMVAGANTGCKPSKAHPYPVVLVHATLSDEAQNWVTLSPLLANAGYCVFAFNYGATQLSEGGRIDGLGDIPTSAGQLSTFINKVLKQTGGTQVDLVGHSQGGLMPNYYIKFLGGASKVHTFVALAPSNHGTTEDGLVTLINAFPIAPALGALISDIGAPALVQQEVGSAFETKTFAGGDTVPGPRYVVIETTHDEVVTPYTNAFLNGPNVTNITVQNQCPSDPVAHIGMFEDSPSLQDVLNQLGPDSPSFKPTCTNEGEGI